MAMELDPGLVCFQHCSHGVFIASNLPSKCLHCNTALHTMQSLLDTPYRLPFPFKRASQSPCCIVIRPTQGDFLHEYNSGNDLHIGLTDSNGQVHEYDCEGLHTDATHNFNQCLVVNILDECEDPVWQEYWNTALAIVEGSGDWTQDRYGENSYNCYTFVLSFLQQLQPPSLQNIPISKVAFCSAFILPCTAAGARYIYIYRRVLQEGVAGVKFKPHQEKVFGSGSRSCNFGVVTVGEKVRQMFDDVDNEHNECKLIDDMEYHHDGNNRHLCEVNRLTSKDKYLMRFDDRYDTEEFKDPLTKETVISGIHEHCSESNKNCKKFSCKNKIDKRHRAQDVVSGTFILNNEGIQQQSECYEDGAIPNKMVHTKSNKTQMHSTSYWNRVLEDVKENLRSSVPKDHLSVRDEGKYLEHDLDNTHLEGARCDGDDRAMHSDRYIKDENCIFVSSIIPDKSYDSNSKHSMVTSCNKNHDNFFDDLDLYETELFEENSNKHCITSKNMVHTKDNQVNFRLKDGNFLKSVHDINLTQKETYISFPNNSCTVTFTEWMNMGGVGDGHVDSQHRVTLQECPVDGYSQRDRLAVQDGYHRDAGMVINQKLHLDYANRCISGISELPRNEISLVLPAVASQTRIGLRKLDSQEMIDYKVDCEDLLGPTPVARQFNYTSKVFLGMSSNDTGKQKFLKREPTWRYGHEPCPDNYEKKLLGRIDLSRRWDWEAKGQPKAVSMPGYIYEDGVLTETRC